MTQPWFFRFGCWPFWTPRASGALGWKENVAQPNEWTMVAWAPPKKNNNTRVEWLLLVETSCMCFKSHGIKNSLTIFSFYYLSSPPPTPERHPEISSHAMPLCHGVPKPLQWWFTWKQWDNHLYNDFKWTGGLRTGKKNAFGYPEIGIEIQSSTTYFFGGGGKGRGSCHVL